MQQWNNCNGLAKYLKASETLCFPESALFCYKSKKKNNLSVVCKFIQKTFYKQSELFFFICFIKNWLVWHILLPESWMIHWIQLSQHAWSAAQLHPSAKPTDVSSNSNKHEIFYDDVNRSAGPSYVSTLGLPYQG